MVLSGLLLGCAEVNSSQQCSSMSTLDVIPPDEGLCAWVLSLLDPRNYMRRDASAKETRGGFGVGPFSFRWGAGEGGVRVILSSRWCFTPSPAVLVWLLLVTAPCQPGVPLVPVCSDVNRCTKDGRRGGARARGCTKVGWLGSLQQVGVALSIACPGL